MKILKILVLIISLIPFVSYSQNNCKKYFRGKWKYKDAPKDSLYVFRTFEKQREYTKNGKYHYDFKIRWLTDCEYELTYVGTTSPHPAVIKIGETLNIKIIKIDNVQMTYKTVFRDLQEEAEMERVE